MAAAAPPAGEPVSGSPPMASSPPTSSAPADSPPMPAGSARQHTYVRRLVGSTFNYGLGKFAPKIIRFLLTFVFTRILSPEQYGFIDLSSKFGDFLTTPMKLGVPGAITRFYFDFSEGPSLKDYVTTVAWFVGLCTMTVGLVALVISPWLLGHFIPGLPYLPFAVLAIVSAMLVCMTELQERLVQAREQSGYAARLYLGRASIAIVLAVLFVAGFRWGAAGMLGAEVVSYLALALLAIRYLRPEVSGRFRLPMLRSSLAYGMAMLPGDFAGSLTPLVTQAILADAQSVSAVGMLGVAGRFAQPLIILAYAFQTAFNPIYFSIRKEATPGGMQRLAVTARNVWALAIFGGVGTALLGPWVIVLMTPSSFHAAGPLLPIYVVFFLGMVIQSLFAPEIYYSKQTWWVPVVAYSGSAVNIAVTVLTVHRFGATGVAWAMASERVATALIFAVISMRLVMIPHQWFNLARITLCGAAAAAAVFWIPRNGGIAELGIGTLGIAAFPIVLWMTGDPSIREGLHLARRIWARESQP
ncbi:MAG TPA: lipopolysaccharide biosynthesis protein [Pirellulales bacterium]|nr:lipopolysaccharide biosynthesis protein [Pirellulales bacterium]